MGYRKLGKISHVHFGFDVDYPFLFGLELTFTGKGWGVGSAGAYMINMGKDCKWGSPADRDKAVTENIDRIREIMEKANVNNVADLEGIPVEVTFNDNDVFDTFRILEEVL